MFFSFPPGISSVSVLTVKISTLQVKDFLKTVRRDVKIAVAGRV